MKNLVILHLESISRQRLAVFESAFPNTRRLLREALAFDNFFSSATSTLMVVSYLFHGNDFEFDTSSQSVGMLPAGNNRNLFSILRDRGYNTQLIGLNAFHTRKPTALRAWPADLPPVWGTNDFPTLFARFDELTDAPPFAIFVWDLITHIEHSKALAPFSSGLTDQIRRACAVADDALGVCLATLERKGLLENTTIVAYGDHGDDFWTHGYRGGMIHALEPYTDLIWVPMAIRDPGLIAGNNDRLASTIDIAPTCLSLLGIEEKAGFPYSGTNLLEGERDLVFSQNFTANQPDETAIGIAQGFSVTDMTYTLVVSSRGLELYAYRLDPGNHCNLLHFFDMDGNGRLVLRDHPGAAGHFRAAIQENPRAVDSLANDFQRLRNALIARVEAKRAYIIERGVEPIHALDRRCLDTISQEGRETFYRRAGNIPAARAAVPAYQVSYKVR